VLNRTGMCTNFVQGGNLSPTYSIHWGNDIFCHAGREVNQRASEPTDLAEYAKALKEDFVHECSDVLSNRRR
jgi:hypothetical protein